MNAPDSDPDNPPGRSPSRRWRTTVIRGIPRVRIPYTELESVLRRLARGERAAGEVSVIVADDRIMRRLNNRFRRKNKPTDVLAFPLGPATRSQGIRIVEGEIYINHDHARRWQARAGDTLAAELTRLAVHGTLHLLGYRHETPAQRQKMSAAEDRYLRAEGLIGKRTRERAS
ncbi:MAG TPA: rRNA maturation RNase YbeY [candidate division Zixibacteria bacterium]|nr:rRNA maturation RNase YbeY [candidate division Zixibacteria bacterium]